MPTPKDFTSLSEEGYKKNVIAFRCVNLIGDALSGLPLNLFKRSRTGKELVEDHDAWDLLENPNPLQSKEAMLKSLTGYVLISGNGYLESVTANGSALSRPIELWALRSDRFTITPGPMGLPSEFVYSVGNDKKIFEVDALGRSNITHVKTFNPTNDWYGMGAIEAASFDIDILNNANLWNLSLLQNSARPSGAFIVKSEQGLGGVMSPDQREQFRKELAETCGGAGNNGRPMLLEGGLDWREMSMSPEDMDFFNSKNTSAKDVALAFGVPGQLVGIDGSQTFANYEQAKLSLYTDTILPLAKMIFNHINNEVISRFGEGLFFEIDEDRVQALEPLRQKKWQNAQAADWLTINEKREMTGFGAHEPTDDPVDQILINPSLFPLDIAAEPQESNASSEEMGITGDRLETVASIVERVESKKIPRGTAIALISKALKVDMIEAENILGDAGFNKKEDSRQENFTWCLKSHFNIDSRAQRRRMWALQLRKRRELQDRFEEGMESFFEREERMLKKEMEGVPNDLKEFVALRVLEKTREDLEFTLSKNIERTVREFGRDTLSIKNHVKGIETKDAESAFNSFVREFVTARTGEAIKLITSTTKRKIKKVIKDFIFDVESGGEAVIGSKISDLYSGFTKARARTVARTEVHTASNEGSRAAAKALDIPQMQKEWLSSLDDRSRDGNPESTNHITMNGVKVDVTEKFSVPSSDGPDEMEGPGDPSAPADQIINCRCTTIYVVPEEEV